MELAAFFLDQQALDLLLHNPAGPVGRDTLRRARNVEARAKGLAPVGSKPYRTGGKLRRSIHVKPIARDGLGIYIDIGSDLDYALAVEQGQPPRVILPNEKKALWWVGMTTPISNSPSRGSYQGEPLPVRQVRWPGFSGKPYLVPSLSAAAL